MQNCIRTNHLGDPCRMKVTQHVGEHQSPMCTRHANQWNADKLARMEQLTFDHDAKRDSHRKELDDFAFAEQWINEEGMRLWCQHCRDEKAAEELGGIPRDKVAEAQHLKGRIEKTISRQLGRRKVIVKALYDEDALIKDESVKSLNYVLSEDDFVLDAMADLCRQVLGLVGQPKERYNPDSEKWNLWTAYERVQTQCREALVSDRWRGRSSSALSNMNDAAERAAAAKFVESYWYF